MEFGSGLFPPSVDVAVEYTRYLDRAANAYTTAWVTDSHQLWTEAYTTLAVCAHETDTVALAPGVTNPVTRHPSVTASAVATIDTISDGRAKLGIGAGDSAVYSIGKTPATVAELREAVVDIRTLVNGGSIEYDGVEFALDAHDGSVEVYVAAEGPKTLRMAGEVADTVLFGGGTEPSVVEELGIANIREGAERAGRDPDDIDVAVLAPACLEETTAAGVKRLKPILEPIAYHNFSFSVGEAPEHLHDDLHALVEAHEMREHGKADAERPEDISPEALDYIGDRFAITGTAADCRDRLNGLAELGVDEVLFGFAPDAPLEQAERFDDEVLDQIG
jgi:5,10-methylenetetrahydromethanopterin reductase